MFRRSLEPTILINGLTDIQVSFFPRFLQKDESESNIGEYLKSCQTLLIFIYATSFSEHFLY